MTCSHRLIIKSECNVWFRPRDYKISQARTQVLLSGRYHRATKCLRGRRGLLDKIRFEMLDADSYLIGLPGGVVGDLRAGKTRQMERNDFLSRRLRITAKQQPTPIYDYFMRSISSANDQPADLEWMRWMERLLGYCLLGALPYHIWPLWTGLLGHVSIETTERYLGCKQKLRHAVNDAINLEDA